MIRKLPILIFLLPGCISKHHVEESKGEKFQIPVVVQPKNDTANYFEEQGLPETWPYFVGQYKFSDSLFFSGLNDEKRQITEAEYRWESRAFDFDTLSSDGLQIIPDYATTLSYKDEFVDDVAHFYFPVYIVNETSEPKIFIGKDHSVASIQEATDLSQYSQWYAIESAAFDYCGHGYFRRKILPKEFVMFLMRKYPGSNKTFLRVRVKIGNTILVSKAFKGFLNPEQFIVRKGSWHYEILKNKKVTSVNWMFYGANFKGSEQF